MSQPPEGDLSIIKMMQQASLQFAEDAKSKHYRNEYHMTPEQQMQQVERWQYIERRIAHLCNELKWHMGVYFEDAHEQESLCK